MTRIAAIYGCRNCSLLFQFGVTSGPTLRLKSLHHYVCIECGLAYCIEAQSKSLKHPLNGFLYSVPNYVPANPKYADIDIIQKAIKPSMKMGDISKFIQELPVRKKWINDFNSAYQKVEQKLGKDIALTTADELREACSSYQHSVYDLYGANQLSYMTNSKTFWAVKDQHKNTRSLRAKPPQYTQHVAQIIIYQKNNTTRLRPHEHFQDTICINCKEIGRIGVPLRNDNNLPICPSCRKPQIDVIFGGLRTGTLI